MSKAIHKVLALLLASLILLSSLSFLNAKTLNLAEESASNSEEPMVEESEVQVAGVDVAKTTASKLVESNTEARKEVVAPEAETTEQEEEVVVAPNAEATEEVVVAESGNIETENSEELVIPEGEEPATSGEEEQKAEEPAIEVPVAEQPSLEEPSTETTVPDTTETTEPEVPEVSDSKVEVEEDVVLSEAENPEESVLPEGEEPTTSGEEEQKAEEPAIEVPVTEQPSLEEPSTETTVPDTTEATEPEVPEVLDSKVEEDLVIPEGEEPATSGEEEKVEEPAIKVPDTQQPSSVEPTTEPESEEVVLEETGNDESQLVEDSANENTQNSTDGKALDLTEYEGKITQMLSDENSSELKVKSLGPHWLVNFAIFKCDTNKCQGFKDGVDQYYEGRRGGYEIHVNAPEAKDGYVFKAWKKLDPQPLGKEEILVDVYEAVYEKAPAETSAYTVSDSLVETSEATVSDLLVKQPIIDVKDLDTNVIVGKSIADDEHECFKPKSDDNWTIGTELNNGTEHSITITYGGCYSYVSFAKFECNLSMCVGFDGGVASIEKARRGGCTETVYAPKAKEGYRFTGWTKRIDKIDNEDGTSFTVDVYTANYELINA